MRRVGIAAASLFALTACGDGDEAGSGAVVSAEGKYYVDPAGQCAKRTPCYQTLADAVVASFKSQFLLDINGRVTGAKRPNDPPDVITVMPGIYRATTAGRWVLLLGQNGEDYPPGTWKLRLVAEQGPAMTTISGDNSGPCIWITDYVDLEINGFTITNCVPVDRSLVNEKYAVFINSYTHARVHLVDNRIVNNNQVSGIGVLPYNDGFIQMDIRISRNLVSGSINGIVFEQFPSTSAPNVAQIVVANNVIIGNAASTSSSEGRGLALGGAPIGFGAVVNDSIVVDVVHNTISGSAHMGLLISNSRRIFNVQNNIIFGQPFDIYTHDQRPDVKNNLIGEMSHFDGGINKIGDPLFSNVAAGNVDLLPGSPAIDGGVSLYLPEAAVDFRGTSRPVDGDGDGIAVPDIGAIEKRP